MNDLILKVSIVGVKDMKEHCNLLLINHEIPTYVLLSFGENLVKEVIHALQQVYRVLRRQNQTAVKSPNPKCVAKNYEQKLYQYTAIDECSRFRYLEAFKEQSSYNSAVFVEHLLKNSIQNRVYSNGYRSVVHKKAR